MPEKVMYAVRGLIESPVYDMAVVSEFNIPHYSSYNLVSMNIKRFKAISSQLCAKRQPLGLL